MPDAKLRQLERASLAQGDPEAAARLAREKVRRGAFEEPARRFVDVLTSEGALWLAGRPWYITTHDAGLALAAVLQGWGLSASEAWSIAYDDELRATVRELCRARARREWDPLAAIRVLGNRDDIKAALGIERMPAGTAAEERRQRQAWVEQLPRHLADTDVAVRSWRPPKSPPRPMGWEELLPASRRGG